VSLLEKLFALGRVLRAGESLNSAAAWKNVQILGTAFSVLLGTIIIFVPIGLSETQIHEIAFGLADLVAAINIYFTAATSDKVGLPNKKNR
jgi:hypothetical protein